MKKLVPDPPLTCTTASRSFGNCGAGHPPLFSVASGITAHDALVHVALYLRCAYDTGYKALDDMHPLNNGLLWSNLHSVEMAQGLVESLIDRLEDVR